MIRSSTPSGLESPATLSELDERSRDIFRRIVEAYLDTGDPVGSRTLSRQLQTPLSPASIRNVMSDLEAAGLLAAPHHSAGRLPTHAGLRLFVDAFLQIGDLPDAERARIESMAVARGRSPDDALSEAIGALSGLSNLASLVVAPKRDTPIKHIEFRAIGQDSALVILVTADGAVENRVIPLPPGMMFSKLEEATNYLNARLRGRRIDEMRDDVLAELRERRAELDELTSKIVEAGLADWSGQSDEPQLIVRGQGHLLDDVTAADDIARIRMLFDDLERRSDFVSLLDLARDADGVRVFIGAENRLFSLSGSSVIVAPYMNAQRKVVGAIGVIGPTRMNYGRIVPMVDHTARVLGRLLG